jgi:hypothetical protein
VALFHEEFDELMELVHAVENNASAAEDGTAAASGNAAASRNAAATGSAEVVGTALEMPAPPLMNAPQRCRAMTVAGTQCRNRAQAGSDYCRMHMQAAEDLPGP